MRFRVTVRGEGTEIRGYATPEALRALAADGTDQFYTVVASPADEDYDPFKEVERLRAKVARMEAAVDAAFAVDAPAASRTGESGP